MKTTITPQNIIDGSLDMVKEIKRLLSDLVVPDGLLCKDIAIHTARLLDAAASNKKPEEVAGQEIVSLITSDGSIAIRVDLLNLSATMVRDTEAEEKETAH